MEKTIGNPRYATGCNIVCRNKSGIWPHTVGDRTSYGNVQVTPDQMPPELALYISGLLQTQVGTEYPLALREGSLQGARPAASDVLDAVHAASAARGPPHAPPSGLHQPPDGHHALSCSRAQIVKYRKVSNIRRTLVGNKIVDHSDVVGASPVGAAPTTPSFST